MDQHLFYKGPSAFIDLRHFYWKLREVRSFDNAARVKWYRRIKKEKDRLVQLGFSSEHIRLYCRYMSNPQMDSPALRRLWAYEQAVYAFAGITNKAKAKQRLVRITMDDSSIL